jgi:ketosteroid isomerase-like protein
MARMTGASDIRSIEEIGARWQAAWNRHDMRSLGALVDEDVDFVNVRGVRLKGRDAPLSSDQLQAEHHDHAREAEYVIPIDGAGQTGLHVGRIDCASEPHRVAYGAR